MKKIFVALISCLLLPACNATSIGIIGGADGPTSVIVGEVGGDKWGLSLYAENVTNSGMTIIFKQSGAEQNLELNTGSWFKLEKNIDGEWTPVDTNPLIDYGWDDVAYVIKNNATTELDVEWKWLYGELEPGAYRLSKEIQRSNKGSFDKDIYYVHFEIME